MWAYNETFYQIYPIGFCGAPVHNDGVPAHRILKFGKWAGYLEELGIGSIILNPIFESDNHGYDTRDFTKIDCRPRNEKRRFQGSLRDAPQTQCKNHARRRIQPRRKRLLGF